MVSRGGNSRGERGVGLAVGQQCLPGMGYAAAVVEGGYASALFELTIVFDLALVAVEPAFDVCGHVFGGKGACGGIAKDRRHAVVG